MDQVIIFDKSLQQRLQEYKDVLAGYEILPVSEIQKEWGFFLELTVDPNGWQAVWKINRTTCEALEIPFPSIVLVFVLSVDFKELTALVKVLAVQDDIHIPDKHYVPLVQLWATKDQDKSIVLNLQCTANSLDMLRFFYNNILMPWDYEDDDADDWKSKHLEPRLRLYYDMKHGVLPRITAEHLQALLTEAKRLQAKREVLESHLADSEDCSNDVNVNNVDVQALMELHIRMMEIKNEIEILENPVLRGALIKKHMDRSLVHDETEHNIWVVYSEGTASDYIQFLTKVEAMYPKEVLKFTPQLCSALECANSNDIFILKESAHVIKSTGALEHGGTLKGISSSDHTILTSKAEDIMLDFRGENVLLENMTIQAITPQCAIIVRKGQLTLKNCKLIGDGRSSTHQGIIVLNGGSLEIIDCQISNFCTAIVGNSGANIRIEDGEIYNCNFGLNIFDNCAVKALKVIIRNCKDYGICVETDNFSEERLATIGNFDTLNIIPRLQMEFIKGDNNGKGDAIVNQKSKLQPVENLFETLETDPTVCIESDEDM